MSSYPLQESTGIPDVDQDLSEGFGMVMNRVLDHLPLSMKGAMAYVSLTTFVQREKGHKDEGKCYARREVAARRARMSIKTFDRAVSELEELGLVTVQRRKHANGGYRSSLYTILDTAEGVASIRPAQEGVASDCLQGRDRLTPPSGQIDARVGTDCPEGGGRLTPLEQTTEHTTVQTTSSDHVVTPSLAPAARSRKEAAPQRPKSGVDQEALRLALDSMAEHSDYDWRPSWTTYLAGVEQKGFTIQPWYVAEIQSVFASILMEKDRLTLDACVERILAKAERPYLTQSVATFAVSRMFHEGFGPVTDDTVAYWTVEQQKSLLAWVPKQTAPEVVVPLQRGSDTVSNGEEKPLPVNALVAMRERVLGKPVAPKPKTAEDLEIEQRIREEEESNARWAAMSPVEREAFQAKNRRLAGDLAREFKATQEKAIQEAEERGMAKQARRSADHARAWASMTIAS